KEGILRHFKILAFLLILIFMSFIFAQFAILLIYRNGSWNEPLSFSLCSFTEERRGHLRLPIHGEFNCEKGLLAASSSSPTDANRVRPADIKYIAALGDSFTVQFISYASHTENAENAKDARNCVGNSFVTGGNGALENHLTLTNVFRHLNPSLMGYSTGSGLQEEHANLNVAKPDMRVNDIPRQARELVRRFQKYSVNSLRDDWKLINIYIGTRDVTGLCIGEASEELMSEFRNAGRNDQTVIVQHIFDHLWTPLRKDDGSYNTDFYATDMFHLSNYGNTKQLWNHLVSPDYRKFTNNKMMNDESPILLCPKPTCPFIRTSDNSVYCN
ncbi:hypothetical protein PFISCL1PPCAC_11925, partial [Pristionchus fissidentatus]